MRPALVHKQIGKDSQKSFDIINIYFPTRLHVTVFGSVWMQEDWSLFNIGTHSSCKLRMKEEDSELSDDLAENTQVRLLVIENST